jgi:prepilin-type N-terminal cleavage/methylation domain-containing protein
MCVDQSVGKKRPGFTTIELIIVMAIMGILVSIAVPTYINLVPRSEIKADAQAVKQLLQKARLNASSYQRPVRVLLDCTAPSKEKLDGACRLEAQIPVYNSSGAIKNWNLLPGGRVFMHKGTTVTYESNYNLVKPRYNDFTSFFNTFQLISGGVANQTYGVATPNSFVVAYLPNGEAVTYCPVIMRFANSHSGAKYNWLLTIVNSTGHIRLVEDSNV